MNTISIILNNKEFILQKLETSTEYFCYLEYSKFCIFLIYGEISKWNCYLGASCGTHIKGANRDTPQEAADSLMETLKPLFNQLQIEGIL